MPNYALIKLNNGNPIQMQPSDDNTLLDGFDEIWTWQEWLDWLNNQPIAQTAPYTKEYIHKLAEEYQDLHFDNKGMIFLSDLKTKLMFMLQGTVTSNLTYQMVEAVNRWVNKVWAKAFEYDHESLVLFQTPTLDYANEVGLPPCTFRDILWTVDLQFQALEPNRPVNQDINYYINWV
jgi:hypothetical protein